MILKDFTAQLGSQMDSVRTEFEDRLQSVQSKINALVAWGTVDVTADQLNSIQFSSIDSTLLDTLQFAETQKRDIEIGVPDNTRVWNSDDLNRIEAGIVTIISSSNDSVLKELTSNIIPDSLRDILIKAQNKSDARDLSVFSALLALYPSADTPANDDWLVFRNTLKQDDRSRSIFYSLFKSAQETFAWAQQTNKNINDMHVDFTSKYNELLFTLVSSNIEIYRSSILSNLSEFENKVSLANSQLDVAQLTFGKESIEYDEEMKQVTSRLQLASQDLQGKVGANMKSLAARIEAGKNVADGYKSIFAAYGGQFVGVSSQTVTTEGA